MAYNSQRGAELVFTDLEIEVSFEGKNHSDAFYRMSGRLDSVEDLFLDLVVCAICGL